MISDEMKKSVPGSPRFPATSEIRERLALDFRRNDKFESGQPDISGETRNSGAVSVRFPAE